MKLKLLLLGIVAVIGVFMIHSCSDDYYLEDGFESLAERRITRSNAEPDGSGTLIDLTIDTTFTQRFYVDKVYIGYDYMDSPLYSDYEITLGFYQYTNPNGSQPEKTKVELENSHIFCKRIYYLVNGLRISPDDSYIEDCILEEELTSFSPDHLYGLNQGDGAPIPFNYYITLSVGEKKYQLKCGYPDGCTGFKEVDK